MSIQNVIFAGPLSHDGQVGGVVLLFEDLINIEPDCFNVIDTNSKNFFNSFSMVFNFIMKCLVAAVKGNMIALHGTARDYKYLGLILLVLHYSTGLKYHTRKFGGNYDDIFISYSKFWKYVVSRFLINSSANYFETHNLVRYFSKLNPKCFWFPNYRESSQYQTDSVFHGRIVFIGHVKSEKGIDEILALNSMMPNGWCVDIYGPIEGYAKMELSCKSIKYKGIAAPGDVAKIISKYDILLLPTFHSGEGYPGVVLEAFSVGVPVVVSNWRALPEIVDTSCGALVEIKNASSLLQGIRQVVENYTDIHIGANKRFHLFDKNFVLPKYIDDISM